MYCTKTILSLLSLAPLAWTAPHEKSKPIAERKALAGCPDGAYLLYSTPAGLTCIGKAGLGIVASIAAPTAALIIANVKAAWSSNMPAPYPASVSAPSSERRDGLAIRDSTVTAYNVESYPGFDYHDANNPDSDNDWVGIFDSMIDYMNTEQIECLQALGYGDETNYENRFTIWLQTSDGVDHRSC
ncbi:hypothetical protein M409DRAFT_60385 [Zasmidium cellare ATCC 36951]|uniref:Ecp2 effector protein domain-containing protein n=1 Tax=Zasmidium cellare ATCC 36951 TaxID=1080233 RepID=A0A6A6BYW1_ZASCE|nr:uncharacterized protein M409DRAFT_60385 [Zasmidium cellare ATCC 36951]KAF2159984.1 hypothetical protein M409DRAFT_60385 [Zasmidium cellare ATCC 36951]